MAEWQDEVLDFWFGELTHEDRFGGAPEVDQKIRDRFEPLYKRLARSIPPEALSEGRSALAAIIVYDQFPRNMYRRKPEAFGTDAMALQIARNAFDTGIIDAIQQEARAFVYMPFMHSEVLADQERCVDLFKSSGIEEAIKFAIEHRDIVARYGRFPHRNKALGRKSTPDEVEFLKTHSGYGQKSDEPEEA
jgi:uncharacterized protein (DUF924 family)